MSTGDISPGVKRTGCEADKLPLFIAEVENNGANLHSVIHIHIIVLNFIIIKHTDITLFSICQVPKCICPLVIISITIIEMSLPVTLRVLNGLALLNHFINFDTS
jgi:hypothetical protein